MKIKYETKITDTEAAIYAFFDTLARCHPEITTGDIDPGSYATFRAACEKMANEWVETNSPEGV